MKLTVYSQLDFSLDAAADAVVGDAHICSGVGSVKLNNLKVST